MSEQENQPPSPPRPTVKTSAVPLKKETVRITLRPTGPGGDAPPPPPPAPVAATAPIPPAPSAPAPPAPRPVAPTVPLAPPPRPMAPGAPPPPAAGGPPRPAPPSAPIGSKTIPLSQPPARPTTPMTGRPTSKIGGGTPTTQPLPRATVKLQPTATPSAPISSVQVRTGALEDDEEVDEGPLNIMGWVALVGAIVAAFFVWATWDEAPGNLFAQESIRHNLKTSRDQHDKEIDSWKKIPVDEGLKLNADYSPFDVKVEGGKIASDYDWWQPKTPSRPTDPYGGAN